MAVVHSKLSAPLLASDGLSGATRNARVAAMAPAGLIIDKASPSLFKEIPLSNLGIIQSTPFAISLSGKLYSSPLASLIFHPKLVPANPLAFFNSINSALSSGGLG